MVREVLDTVGMPRDLLCVQSSLKTMGYKEKKAALLTDGDFFFSGWSSGLVNWIPIAQPAAAWWARRLLSCLVKDGRIKLSNRLV